MNLKFSYLNEMKCIIQIFGTGMVMSDIINHNEIYIYQIKFKKKTYSKLPEKNLWVTKITY